MLTHRTARIATLIALAAVTTSVVLAAKPSNRPAPARSARAITPVTQTVAPREVARAITVPADLAGHRMKIRLRNDLGARLLPDGRLMSLRGRDLSALSLMLERMNVTLEPAVNLPESTLVDLRRRIEANGGDLSTLPDVGATFWVNGESAVIAGAARRLSQLGEVEFVDFTRVARHQRVVHQTEPATSRPARREPARPVALDIPEPNIDNGSWDDDDFDVPYLPNAAERAAIAASAAAELEQLRIASVNARIDRRPARFDVSRGGDTGTPRGATGACCTFTFDPDVGGGRGPGYLRDCVIVTEDVCDGLVSPGVPFVEYQGDGTACDPDCMNVAFGACCAGIGTRGGEDSTQLACDPTLWDGDFAAPVPVPPGIPEDWETYFVAYTNCDACPLVFGSCCFASTGTTSFDLIGGDDQSIKFNACNTAFAGTPGAPGVPFPVTNSPAEWSQMDVEPGSLAQHIGDLQSVTVEFLPFWQGTEVDEFARLMNRPGRQRVINSARLVTNTEDETACSRCISLGGAWMGPVDELDPGTYPVIPFLGELICGNGGAYFQSCLDGQGTDPGSSSDFVLGACTSANGSTSIETYQACQDAASAMNVRVDRIWMGTMLDPERIDPLTGLHEVHSNNWRPGWTIWFTPPSNSMPDPDFGLLPAFETWCPPINPFNPGQGLDPLCMFTPPAAPPSPEYLVPVWEYAGTYIEWTGWDPGRWYDEGVTLGLTREQFLAWYPPITGQPGTSVTGLYPAWTSADAALLAEPSRVVMDPGPYGPVVRFGLPPTCDEFIQNGGTNTGLATLRGEPLIWNDPDPPFGTGESLWPVYPMFDMCVYSWQIDGTQSGLFGNPNTLFPWTWGWNRWTNDSRMFDIDQGLQANPAFHLGSRYVNMDQPGVTTWEYQGDQAPVPPSLENAYIFPRFVADAPPADPGEPVRGSCFFPHSARFPTLLGTDDNEVYPDEQECYIGDYCDDAACCSAVADIVPRCCDGTGDTWDALCVQVALDLNLLEMGQGLAFEDQTCRGITPFLLPQYPDWEENSPTYQWPVGVEIPEELMAQGQYNPDPRNVIANPYLHGVTERDITVGVLPRWINPSYLAPPAAPCLVADVSPENQIWPLPTVPPEHADYAEYDLTRNRTGRLFQFVPRCMGMYSSAGQCNVPGTQSGRSAWSEVAQDEEILVGCQDFDCCMRVMAAMLSLKDNSSTGDEYSDFEWMPKQWTPQMALIARNTCYPELKYQLVPTNENAISPNFFPLQLHAGSKAFEETLDQGGNLVSEAIVSPDGTTLTDNTVLRDLTWAPFSFSDVNEQDGTTCFPPHQNIYGVCPDPYYRATGMAIWPDTAASGIGTGNAPSFAAEINFLAQASGLALNAFGEDVRIAVLGESAWIQQWTSPDGLASYGAVHEDLTNVILEGPTMGYPEVFMDFSDEEAAARGTAVLGVIAATDNGSGVTGMAHDAEVHFFPTHHIPNPGGPTPSPSARVRTEDAFVHALGVLRPGDIMLLAMQATSDSGFVLDDPTVQGLMPYAQALGILVVVPAGDTQQAVTYSGTGVENIVVVGGATPSSEDNYIRWWSSNFSASDTVVGAFDPGSPSLCAWGGGVATTGGNANLSLLTMSGPPDAAPAGTGWASGYGYDLFHQDGAYTGQYRLTEAGMARSYTNDFGSQLDGSVAAAAQVAASLACMQGFSMDWYTDPLNPLFLTQTMWDTAVFGDGVTTPSGDPLPPGNAGGTFTWDLDEAGAAAGRSVGRMPQMANFLRHIVDNPPTEDDFTDPITHRIVALGVITGTQVSGDMISLMIPGDGDELHLRTAFADRGWVDSPVWVPGPINYTSRGEVTDFMVTFQTEDNLIAALGVGFDEIRSGPLALAFNTCWVFNFARNKWEGFDPLVIVDPGEDPPVTDNFRPYVEAYGIDAYREPGTGRLYVRFYCVTGDSSETFNEYIDLVDFDSELVPDD